MTFNVHAGHNPDGKIACGAVGLIQESTEARNVKNSIITKLKQLGHIVYDCTCEDGTSQGNVLKKIVTKCNEHNVDLDISIHFNSGACDDNGNGTTTGTEVLVHPSVTKAHDIAQNVVNKISELGFKNRGVKVRDDLYFLNQTNSDAILIECCFVDDRDDVNNFNVDKMATAIVCGVCGIDSLNTHKNGLSDEKESNGDWCYYKDNKVDTTFNGLAQNKNGWWYVRNGKVDFNINDVVKHNNDWYVVRNGKVDFKFNGLAKNSNGWWYCKNSKVDFGYNGLAVNENGVWVVENGKVNFNANGVISVKANVLNGKVVN